MTKANKNDPRGSHGTDIFENRAREFGTQIQEVPMAAGETPRGKYGYGKGRLEDAVNTPKGKTK